jgi:hypothetical protein
MLVDTETSGYNAIVNHKFENMAMDSHRTNLIRINFGTFVYKFPE